MSRVNDMIELNKPLKFFMHHVLDGPMTPVLSLERELHRINPVKAFRSASVTFGSSVV